MIAPVSFFRREVTTLWATTYQFDLKLFDQFLLRRLGNPPLDVVVLADEACITDALMGLTDIDCRIAANANSRYLLRGMRPASSGRFHPKTYFFHSRGGARLLVGSGNLTRAGLDRGRETFVAFDAHDAEGAAVIRAWAAWIGELVLERDDPLLRARYERLRVTLPTAGDAVREASPFVTNAETPLIETIARRSPPTVAEVHLTAPYLDPRAEALAQLIERLDPSRGIHLYLGARTSVDAAALCDVLAGARCEVTVRRYEPPAFVHAKLIGIVGADGAGLLVCGSANLSQAALMRTSSRPGSWGNVEAVVLREGAAQQVVDAFRAPDGQHVACSIEELQGLTAAPEDEEREAPPPVRLLRAALADDRRIVVHAEPRAVGLLVSCEGDDDTPPLALDADGDATARPVAERHEPLVVRLVDALGSARSNAVVLDDPKALEQMLAQRGDERDRPHELEDLAESSELVGLLAWAHRRMIFDLDDTPAARRAATAQEQDDDVEDTGFFDRYVREELVYDSRSQSYRRPRDMHELTTGDLLLREIEGMLHAAPGERRLRLLHDGDRPPGPGGEEGGGRPWTATARERVRAANLLRRWARALADPRHVWLSEEAPARNYEAVVELLAAIWLAELLDDERVVELLGETWSALLGSDEQQGLLDRLEEPLRQRLLLGLPGPVRDLAAGLACCCMHPDMPWPDYVYAWQPLLVRGLEAGVFAPGPRACELVGALFPDDRPTEPELEDRLLARATWVDDETWGRRTAEALGVAKVQLIAHTRYKDVHAAVRVDELADPARDPRVVALAQRTMAFRKTDDVLVQAGEQRFLLRIGETARALIDGQVRSSPGPLDRARLRAVERQHGSLADLLAS
jgi:hypothetical protein